MRLRPGSEYFLAGYIEHAHPEMKRDASLKIALRLIARVIKWIER